MVRLEIIRSHRTKVQIKKGDLVRVAKEVIRLAGDNLMQENVALSVKLCGTRLMRQLNATFAGHDYATDVLSFPHGSKIDDSYYLGDIIICVPIAQLQASQLGHSLETEFITLFVHGLLHLLGYDHSTREQRDEMENLTQSALYLVGVRYVPGRIEYEQEE
jgi:probable rRNA maturation factor